MATIYIRFPVAGAGEGRRAPLLERLLAQAGTRARVVDWRAEAYPVIAAEPGGVPAAGAAALAGLAGLAGPAAPAQSLDTTRWVCVATPMHLLAGMSSVSVPVDGVLSLAPDDCRSLAMDFNRVFADAGVSLVPTGTGLLCRWERRMEVVLRDPEVVIGREVWDFLPAGADAAVVRRLMSEIEMWLFEHPLNVTRAARALPAVTGLWLWGGGAPLSRLPAVRGWTAGADPLFAAFGAREDFPVQSRRGAPGAAMGLAGAAGVASAASAAVIVLDVSPGSVEWSDRERRWLVPALAALHSGRIKEIKLSAGGRSFSVDARSRLRFWRRRRPWNECFHD